MPATPMPISSFPILPRLFERQISFPIATDVSAMRAWEFGAPLESGVWGISQPGADAPEVDPNILIVPFACFDRGGHRIGYGAGYYDMTITRLRGLKPVVAIGIGFAAQEIPRVPATERDARLDLVLTEREVIDFRKA